MEKGTTAAAAAAVAKSLQSCPTLCDPIDGSPPGSTIPGILQVRTLDWVAMLVGNNKPGLKSGLNLKKLRLWHLVPSLHGK